MNIWCSLSKATGVYIVIGCSPICINYDAIVARVGIINGTSAWPYKSGLHLYVVIVYKQNVARQSCMMVISKQPWPLLQHMDLLWYCLLTQYQVKNILILSWSKYLKGRKYLWSLTHWLWYKMVNIWFFLFLNYSNIYKTLWKLQTYIVHCLFQHHLTSALTHTFDHLYSLSYID